MSDTYIQLKNEAGNKLYPVIPTDRTPVSGGLRPITSGAVDAIRTQHLTLAVPTASDKALYLAVNYSEGFASINASTEHIDTLDTNDLAKVKIFNDTEWVDCPSSGISQVFENKRVMVDLSGIPTTSTIYYSWYYLDSTSFNAVYVEPWVSTKLTATTSVPKHSELQDRNTDNAHSIDSITGLRDALNKDYQEVSIKTDAEMANVYPAQGKVITFIGYSTGEAGGSIVTRYKDYNGNYGNLAPAISASLIGDNLVVNTGSTTTVDPFASMWVDGETLVADNARVEDETLVIE
jgi:hypothetical protein